MDVKDKAIEVKMNGAGQDHPRKSTIFCKTLDTPSVSTHVKFHRNRLTSILIKRPDKKLPGCHFRARRKKERTIGETL